MSKNTRLDDALGLLLSLEAKLHRLRNTWPCGIRVVDDRTDREIANVTKDLEELRPKIAQLRVEARHGQ